MRIAVAYVVPALKERIGYIILVTISVILSLMVLLLGVNARTANNHKFCQVLAIHLTEPVKKPAVFGVNPVQDREWALKLKRAELAKELGCL